MLARSCLAIAMCLTLASSLQAQDLADRIATYFPGEWEYKLEDGNTSGTVSWKKVAGGKSFAGPGMATNGESYSLAGWDPNQKVWFHVWFAMDGQHGRLEVQRFEGDTFHGQLYQVESDGKVMKAKWESKIIDDDHFVITMRDGDDVRKSNWHRRNK